MNGMDVDMSESSTLISNPGNSDQVFFGLPNVFVDKGAHIAHFFRGEEERFAILAPYLHAGLEAGDQCILVAEPLASPIIMNRLRDTGLDVELAVNSGQLLVSDGGTEVEEMASMFEDVISKSRDAGREVIRIAGDMTWALGKMPSAKNLLEWEAFYDGHVGHHATFVALCQYDHSRFGGSVIMCALQTHPLSIIGNIVQENPFYRDPEEVLRELSASETQRTSKH